MLGTLDAGMSIEEAAVAWIADNAGTWQAWLP